MSVSGAGGEAMAATYLAEAGYVILARNWRAGRAGELDIVAQKGGTLVIVEVKTATGERFGNPVAWVTQRKQRQLARLTQMFLAEHDGPFDAVRFDVIAVNARKHPPTLEHLVDAFRPDKPQDFT